MTLEAGWGDLLETEPSNDMPESSTSQTVLATGAFSNGQKWTVKPYSLTWEAHGDVGPVGIPLRAGKEQKIIQALNEDGEEWYSYALARECFAC